MAVTISAPKDSVVNRKNNVSFTITTSLSGLNAYEFVYRLKTASSWSTKGKTSISAASSISVSVNLSDLIDGAEYYYRFILYYDYKDGEGTVYKGYEYSQAYTLVPCTNRVGRLRIKTDNSIEELPLYSETNKSGPKIKVKIASNSVGISNNADNSSTLASRLRTNTGTTGKKTSIRGSGSFAYSNIKPSGELDNRYRYTYYVPEKWDYAYNYNWQYAGFYESYNTGSSYSYVSGHYYIRTDTWYSTNYATGSYSQQHSSSYQKIHYTTVHYTEKVQPSPNYWYYRTIYENHYAYTENGTNYWYTTYYYDYISGYNTHTNTVYGDLYSYQWIYGYRPAYSYYSYQYYYKQYNAHYNYNYYYSHYSYS